jgi:predicted RNA binding protein YcfA (HicA-like mRNA interferase family)
MVNRKRLARTTKSSKLLCSATVHFSALYVKQVSGKLFCAILQQRGWQLARINGSHHIFTKSGQRERIVVPVHGKKPLKLGLLKHQMKIAGLTESEL